eukprot:12260555-Heterocapsa_arctica.AAC.1
MRDCTTRKNHDEDNNRHNGVMYEQEKEEGTQITRIHLSGSQFDFEFMLDHCKDHLANLSTPQRMASLGTCGNNRTYQDGITGRSGGVAILTWNGIRFLTTLLSPTTEQ